MSANVTGAIRAGIAPVPSPRGVTVGMIGVRAIDVRLAVPLMDIERV
jgi:hypothetical protein